MKFFTKVLWTIVVWIAGALFGYVATCGMMCYVEDGTGSVTHMLNQLYPKDEK